jgi:hypothetical protein
LPTSQDYSDQHERDPAHHGCRFLGSEPPIRSRSASRSSLSKRIGHADVAFAMKQYVQTDLEADHEVANTLADLIIGGLLVSGIDEHGGGTA